MKWSINLKLKVKRKEKGERSKGGPLKLVDLFHQKVNQALKF